MEKLDKTWSREVKLYARSRDDAQQKCGIRFNDVIDGHVVCHMTTQECGSGQWLIKAWGRKTELPDTPYLPISSAELLRLQPNDVLHVKCAISLRREEMELLRQQIKSALPEGVNLVVSDAEAACDMEVLRRETAICTTYRTCEICAERCFVAQTVNGTRRYRCLEHKPKEWLLHDSTPDSVALSKRLTEELVAKRKMDPSVITDNCPDCNGTREYRGLNEVTPCPKCCGDKQRNHP